MLEVLSGTPGSVENAVEKDRRIIVAEPRGFCAGVKASLNAVEKALSEFGPPVYVKHEIVHNRSVLEDLSRKGVVFAEDLSEIPPGSTFIISAHGISPEILREAEGRGFRIVDATCPVVKKIHALAVEFSARGCKIILIGHRRHPEIQGITGYIGGEYHIVEKMSDLEGIPFGRSDKIAVLTQTTLDFEETAGLISALKSRYPELDSGSGNCICYATRDRQEAVRKISEKADLVLIIGSANSSNSNRLCEVARKKCPRSFLIEDKNAVTDAMLDGVSVVGISAGASAPEHLVRDLVEMLGRKGFFYRE